MGDAGQALSHWCARVCLSLAEQCGGSLWGHRGRGVGLHPHGTSGVGLPPTLPGGRLRPGLVVWRQAGGTGLVHQADSCITQKTTTAESQYSTAHSTDGCAELLWAPVLRSYRQTSFSLTPGPPCRRPPRATTWPPHPALVCGPGSPGTDSSVLSTVLATDHAASPPLWRTLVLTSCRGRTSPYTHWPQRVLPSADPLADHSLHRWSG